MSKQEKVHVTFRMPEHLFKSMQIAARELGISRTSFINASIYNSLDSELVTQLFKKIKREKFSAQGSVAKE